MKREELIAYDKWLTRRKWGTGEIISPEKAADLYLAEHPLPPAEGAEQEKILTDFAEKMNTAMVNNDPEFEQIVNDHYFDLIEQPTAEGAEEIIDSIVESLGDPINIHNHAFEIRPYTVEHKTEWWIFHKEVSSGEPLAQWLSKFATLHAQKIADKMKEANQFILDIAQMLGIETDGVGFDGITLSIDDFSEAADKMVEERLREELAQFDQWTTREVYIGSSPNIKASYELVDEYLKSRDSHG